MLIFNHITLAVVVSIVGTIIAFGLLAWRMGWDIFVWRNPAQPKQKVEPLPPSQPRTMYRAGRDLELVTLGPMNHRRDVASSGRDMKVVET